MQTTRILFALLCATLLAPTGAQALMMDFDTPGQLGTMSRFFGTDFSESATGGVGGSGSLHMDANGFELAVINNGGAGVITAFGAGDSVTMSADFSYGNLAADTAAGLWMFGDAGAAIDQAVTFAFNTGSNLIFWVQDYSGSGASTYQFVASTTDWYRMAVTYTNNGSDITASAGLYAIGSDGTSSPSEIFSVDYTFSNDTLETTSFLMGGVLGATDIGGSIDFDNVGFQAGTSSPMPITTPEPGSIALMAVGFAGLFAVGRRER